MASLAEIVRDLAARDGVTAAVVVSPDGLPVDAAGVDRPDAEALAALAATLLRPAARLGEPRRLGGLDRVVLKYSEGLVILSAVRNDHWLLLLTTPEADIGTLLFELRRESPVVAARL